MEAFGPALVAIFLTELAGRSPLLAAALGDRFRSILGVLAGLILAQLVLMGVGAGAGALIGQTMRGEARSLMLAIALGLAALGLVRKPKVDVLAGWRIGAFPTAFLGQAILGFGEGSAFLAFAYAAHAGEPAAVAIAGAIGAIAPGFVAMAMGEAAWRRLPLGWMRLGAGLVLGVMGVASALTAFRLI